MDGRWGEDERYSGSRTQPSFFVGGERSRIRKKRVDWWGYRYYDVEGVEKRGKWVEWKTGETDKAGGVPCM